MDDLKEYADRLKFEIVAADFLSTEDREMVFDLIEKVLGDTDAWFWLVGGAGAITLLIGGYCAMEGEDEESDDPRAFGNAAAWKKVIVLVAGVTNMMERAIAETTWRWLLHDAGSGGPGRTRTGTGAVMSSEL